MAKGRGTEAAPSARRRSGPRAGVPTATECGQLRIRVIALENLVIALLAQAPQRQLALAHEMAVHISPRPGFTAHRLTLHAAEGMRSLVVRAKRFRTARTDRVATCKDLT